MNDVVKLVGGLDVKANDASLAKEVRERINELAGLMNDANKRGIDVNFRMGKDEVGAIKAEIVIQRVTVETL